MKVASIGKTRLGVDDAGTVLYLVDGEVIDLPEWRAQMFIRGGLVRSVDDSDDAMPELDSGSAADAPDFEFAAELGKDDLDSYASGFGVKLDKRKSVEKMFADFKAAF